MKPNNDPSYKNLGSADGEVRLSLDASATAHIISVLTDLYSDPILAVIREYSTNARDAHIEAGNTAPIQVTLPSSHSRFFRVKDEGLGLDADGLRDTYSLYGRSTKRDSDEVNGVLGLGCKSALTYSNTFDITAVKNGVKTFATVAKDEDGVGVIKILGTDVVDEPNSVEIVVPVKHDYDIRQFASKAADFYRYWQKGTVLVNGQQPTTVWDDESYIWLDSDVAVSTDDRNSVIVQHNVAYPAKYGSFGNFGVVAFVPVGSVNFTPSREALHYTARTNETIKVLKEYVEESFERRIRVDLASKKVPFERLQVLARWAHFVPKLVKEFHAEHGSYPKRSVGGAAWHFNLSQYRGSYGKAASKVSPPSWFELARNENVLIHGFTAQTIGALSRLRLDTFFKGRTGSLWIVPSIESLAPIQGRAEVYAWDDIVAATKDVRLPGTSKKGQTLYEIYLNGKSFDSLSATDLKDVIDGETLVYYVEGSNKYRLASDRSRQVPGAYVVSLRPVQVERFERLFPQAVEWGVECERQVALAVKSLSTDDRLALHAQDFSLKYLAPKVNEIADPDFVRILKAAKHTSPALAAFKAQSLSRGNVPQPKVIERVIARYPLLGKGYYIESYKDDAVIYINAKYTASLTTNNDK